MNAEIPELVPYDQSNDKPYPWEYEVKAAIEKYKAKKEDVNLGSSRKGLADEDQHLQQKPSEELLED